MSIDRERLRAALRLYGDRRMRILLLLGFSSGLPLLLVYSNLSLWLREEGVALETISPLVIATLPYSIKFVWAPIVDRARLPILSALLGQRRAWMLATQVGLVGAIAAMGAFDPTQDLARTLALASLVAFLAATQDIAIDAYRIEILAPEEQGGGAAMAVLGYRVGMLVAGAGGLYVAEYSDWRLAYMTLGLAMLVGVAGSVLAPRGTAGEAKEAPDLLDAYARPFLEMLRRTGMPTVFLFILAYKLGDAMAGVMTGPFLVDAGFAKTEIANVQKTFGFFATILGVLAGGTLVRARGILGALWVAGVLQMASNLMFAVQAHFGHDVWLLVATIGVENLTGGLGTAAFVAYLSALCDRRYSATQYAMLIAVSGVLRKVLSTPAGELVNASGWVVYFLLTTVVAVPGLVLLWWLGRRGMMRFEEATAPGNPEGEPGGRRSAA